MVYGVSRIALPSCDWGDSLRAGSAKTQPGGAFVAGPENRLVVPAIERLLSGDSLKATAALFNPLVLLGPSGTGKTHLARGITRRWRELLEDDSGNESDVEYLTAIDFARQLRAAREEGEFDSFRTHLSELQLLVVEDLHRLPLRTFVQRELRDTLDVLMEAGAVVVITAQQPPAAMAGLDAGLRDRLSAGLTLRLQPQGVEARRELLQLNAAERCIAISDVQLEQLAQKIEGLAPQLFRALAEHELAAADTTLADTTLAETAFGDAVRTPLKLKQLVGVVARYYSLTQAALCSSARRKSLVYARAIAIYLARTLTEQSYAQIGVALGRRDHTTVMHAHHTIEKRLTSDACTQQEVEELKRILTAV